MRRVEWANSLRGIAALCVIGYHFLVAFWLSHDYSSALARRAPLYQTDAEKPAWAVALGWLPVDFAALGVGLFFLISGYVIAISLDRYSRRGFLVGRVLRLLPTYAAGYLVTIAAIVAVSDPYREVSPSSVAYGSVPGLALLLGKRAPADGILWILLVELVFYAACIALYRLLTRHWQAIAGLAAALALTQALLDPLPPEHAGYGLRYILLLGCLFVPVILVGVTLSARARQHMGDRTALALVVGLTALFLWLASTTAVVPTSFEYRATFVGTIALFTVIAWQRADWSRHGFTSFFSNISYPLYVVHPVLGYALISVLTEHGTPPLLSATIALVAATAVATALHYIVERPTHALGQKWARQLSAGADPDASRLAAPAPAAPSA